MEIKIFFLDIETLGIESTSVILSIGMLHVIDNTPTTYEQLLANSIFLKLSATDQIKNYARTIDRGTIDWWAKQGDLPRKISFDRNAFEDIPVLEAIETLCRWIDSKKKGAEICWIRGTLDQVCLDSLFRAAGKENLFNYNIYRDVRTALQILYPDMEQNGYVSIDTKKCIGFDKSKVLKHSPDHDCAYDAAMLLFGEDLPF